MSDSRADMQRVAAARRDRARELRALGLTWQQVGEHMGVTYQRAQQLAKPVARLRGNPKWSKPGRPPTDVPAAPVVEWRGTIEEYLRHRVELVEQCRSLVEVRFERPTTKARRLAREATT